MVQDPMKKTAILGDPIHYNSGMLLFDVRKWREGGYLEKTIAYLAEAEHLVLADQSIVNKVFKDSVTRLPLQYNYTVLNRVVSDKTRLVSSGS